MDLNPTPQYGLVGLEKITAQAGINVLRAIIAGDIPQPPIGGALNFWLSEVETGLAVFQADTSDDVLNFSGAVHGGWALTLIDSAAGCAAFSTLPAGSGFTTIETKANFNRPLSSNSGRVRCEGRVLSAGRRIISAEAKLFDIEQRLIAHGTSTIMVLSTEN